MTEAARPQLRFVLAEGQNYFFVELAEALALELRAQGTNATVAIGEPPSLSPGVVNVFLPPHEYVALSGYQLPARLMARSIAISAEQPASGFFATNVSLVRDAGAVFDINKRAVRAYQKSGILSARHLQLGYTTMWDPRAVIHQEDERGRDIDVLFIGRITDRRAEALASYADVLERFRCHLQLSDGGRPNLPSAPDFVAGDAKRDLLSRAEILLSIHGEEEPYFEQLRAVEAMCAGCVIVSERSSDLAPFRNGEHLLTGSVERLGLLCRCLLDDRSLMSRIRQSAYDFLRLQLPLRNAARELAEAASRVDRVPVDPRLAVQVKARRLVARHRQPPSRFEYQPPASAHSPVEGQLLRTLKRQEQAVISLKREMANLASVGPSRRAHEGGGYESPSWSGARSEVTVVVPLYNHAEHVTQALDSVERADPGHDVAIVVVDDGSTDDGSRRVVEWMKGHSERACRLVEHGVNRGLPAARNTGAAAARGELLLMLDADNQLRRQAIQRLTAALEQDPQASFAYGILDRFSHEGPKGLLSVFPWEPERLRQGNYIDALALIRATHLHELGGYSEDPRLHGWEDYDLWARMAERGWRGAFVPEIVARYRSSSSSMISVTNVSVTDALAAVAEHAPVLMRGLRIPH